MTTKPAQPAPSGATTAAAAKVNHSPSEVAWMFVREYYHYLNRDPSRLHLFYGKDSAAIHGMEGDHADPAYGQGEIQKMLAAQRFKEARVVISSVDSLSSVNDGVVVQVLGELSNAGNPSQKFVQTFFLAKQPTGFFVLNDVFRYLCEDVEDEGADVDSAPIQQHHAPAAPVPAPSTAASVEKAKPKSRDPSPAKPKSPERRRPASPAPAVAAPEPVTAPAPVEQAKPRALSPAPVAATKPSQSVSGIAEQKPKSREPSPKRAKSPAKSAVAEPVAAEPKKDQVKPAGAAAAAPAPTQRAKSPEKPAAAPVKPAQPAKPATWATLAAKAPASSTGSSPAPTPAPPAGVSPRSQSPAVTAAPATVAEPVLRAVDSTPAGSGASLSTSLGALQVYGSPGQESQQPGGRNPNFHTDVEKSVYVRLMYPAFESATPEFLVSSLPAGVTVKAITYQRQAAVLHLATADEAKAVLGTKLTMNGATTTIEVRREGGGAPGGRGGYGSGQGYRGGYQGGMGRSGSYGSGSQGAPRPASSGGMPRGAGGYNSAQQGSGEFSGRGGAMGGRGGRGRGGPAPTRA